MTQEPRSGSNISEELNRLGRQIADALQLAWESEERRRLQAEVTEGLQRFGDEVEDVAKRASESDAAKRVRAQAEEIAAKARQSDVAEEVREGLLTGLQALNRELTRLLNRLQAEQPAGTGPVPPQAPGPSSEPGTTPGYGASSPVPPEAPAAPSETDTTPG